MFRLHNVARSAVALALAGLVVSCGDDTQKVLGPVTSDANAIFARYVALGNSITAGFQSSGINDSTQRRSYAVLLAAQMGTGFGYPALAGRGCAPPIVNFLTQARFGNTTANPVTGATCDLRTPSFSDLLNNVAVPGAIAVDLTVPARTTVTLNIPSPHIHASLFLGGKSQVQKALDNKPTFASVWIGNNDLLFAAVTGVLFPLPTVSPGLTSASSFTTSMDAAATELTTGAPGLKGVLIGVANLNNIPAIFPTDSLRTNATFLGQFDVAAGRVTGSGDPFKAAALAISPDCTTNQTTTISMLIVEQIRNFRNDTNPTGQAPKAPTARRGHPPSISCTKTNPGDAGFPIGELFMLDATEQAALASTASTYNNYLSAKATALTWAYMDPNIVLDSLKAAGAVPARPSLTTATVPFGAWFSLDGFHPSTQAHRAITNHVIDAINAKYGTSLVKISVP